MYNFYKKYKIITFILLSILGLLFPNVYTDPVSTSTLPSEFINQLNIEDIKKFGTLYTPKILPESFTMQNVSFDIQTIDNNQESYLVTTTYKNNTNEIITFIQSKNTVFNSTFQQEHMIDSMDNLLPLHYYFQEGNPQNTLYWINNENVLFVIYSEQNANILRNLARNINSNPINENTIENYITK